MILKSDGRKRGKMDIMQYKLQAANDSTFTYYNIIQKNK